MPDSRKSEAQEPARTDQDRFVSPRKAYRRPELSFYGDVSQVTREFASQANADSKFKAIWWLAGLMGQRDTVRAGRLFNSTSGQVMTKQVVLIQDERITEVGSEDQVTIPQGARVIDLSQATVLPGLIDGHSHVFDSFSNGQRVTTTNEAWTISAMKEAQTDLRAGFTTMRDCGTHGEGYGDVNIRNAINRGLFDGPLVLYLLLPGFLDLLQVIQ